jgi:hypothetical protein
MVMTPSGSANYTHLNANGTSTIKSGSGWLNTVTINIKGGTGNQITIYDNTSASGTVIAVIDTTASLVTLWFGVAFLPEFSRPGGMPTGWRLENPTRRAGHPGSQRIGSMTATYSPRLAAWAISFASLIFLVHGRRPTNVALMGHLLAARETTPPS